MKTVRNVLALVALLAFPALADDVAGVRLPCEPALVGTTADTAKLFSGIYGAYQSPKAPVDFDIGSPRRISGVSFMVAQPNWSMEFMLKTLTYEASADGVTYEKIFENNNRAFTTGGVYTSYAVDDDHHGPYRYFRVYAKNGNDYWGLQIKDIRVLSEDVSIDGIAPEVWADRSAVSLPGTNEVTFSAKILSATNGTATAYAVYAKKDLGRSFAEWRTKGTVVTLGTGAAGETLSKTVSNIPSGCYFVRYFATSGSDEYVWPLHCDMVIDSSAHLATMYTLSSANFKNVYNENLASTDYVTLRKSNGHSVIFSLADLPADQVISSLRVWMSPTGYRTTIFGLPVEVSFDDVDLETDSEIIQTVGDRVVRSRTSFPDMTWTTVNAFTNMLEKIPYYLTAGFSTGEIALEQAVMQRRPTYLRVTGCTDEEALWPLEFELRATMLPQAPEGEAQVDEAGAAFARVSGKVDYRGTDGGNATLYLVATPKAGGPSVSSVVATDVAEGASFAGFATGLANETAYDWQVVASNATAGAAIARGAFTTLQSSGSLVPLIEMTGATAQADGTVLIGYSMSEAGEGYAVADVYVRYGTDPDDLSNEKLIAAGVVGEGSVAVAGLPPGATLYLALVAKNEGGAVSAVTEQRSCETVGPCGLVGVTVRTAETGCGVTITGTLEPRGVGPAEVYLDYVTDALAVTSSVLAGTIPFGAPSNFTVSATLPRHNCVTGTVRVVNTFGGGVWTNRSDEVNAPLGVRMPSNPTVVDSASETSRLYSRQYTDAWRSQSVPYVFDLGASRSVSGVSFMVNAINWAYSDMLQNLRFEGSADGATYETIFVNAGRPFVKGGVYMNYVAENGHHGPYRYIRVSVPTGPYNYTGFQLCDVRVLSTGLVVEGNRPTYWNLDLQAEQSDEVTFSGCLRSAPAGSAHVYAACSPRNLGDNLADWQTKGTIIDLGTVNEGEFFTNVVSVAAGAYYCRYYAVSGDDVHFSPSLFTFSSDSESLVPAKIYISGDAAASVKAIYNGTLNSYAWYTASTPQMVLPLDAIPAGYRLASVRVWVRPGNWTYLPFISADVSYDVADLDAVSSEVQTVNDRTVRGVSAFPSMTWTAAGSFTGMADVIDLRMNTKSDGAEINLSRSLCDQRPTFIRINHNQTTLTFDEIELRVTEIPPAPEGWAQIDEVGAAFVRTSGHVYSVGAGGGNCTVYFAGTPTAGGASVSSVIAANIANEQDFEGTATGLKSSTEYAWQIVASNETAGAVIASGTFTTQQGSGSPVPVVAMTDATANDDGTVTIGYNVSDAGEGYAVADVYVKYGTDPDHLTNEKLAVAGVVGEGSVAVAGLPPGATLYLALVAKNEGGAVSEVTEQRSCETVGPCGLSGAAIRPAETGCGVTVSGMLSPRGLGDAQVYLDYVSSALAVTTSVQVGTVAAGADSNFTFTAALARCSCITGSVRVVNSFGGVAWTNVADEAAVPLGVRLPCEPTLVSSVSATYPLFNGVYGIFKSADAPYVFDIGAPRLVSGVSFMVSTLHWGYGDMLQKLKFEGSVDGITYETIFVNAGRPFVKGGVYMNYVAENGHHGPYRYIRVSVPTYSVYYAGIQLCDVRVLSTGLAVQGNRPTYWERDLEQVRTNEVTFSGTLLSAPTGSAHVYAVYSKHRLGDSDASWLANGTRVDLGVVNEGESFSVTATVPTGAYFCRYLAVADAETSLAPDLFTFTSDTTSFVPTRVFIKGSATATGLKGCYDGSASSFAWYYTTEPFVFPLDELPAGYRLVSARVWARYGSGLYDISADVSYDDVDLDTGSTEIQTMNNRTVRAVEDYPEMTWTSAGAFTQVSDAIDHSRNSSRTGVEFNLSRVACARHPKFLRIKYPDSTCQVAEIELRCVREPGLAVIVK